MNACPGADIETAPVCRAANTANMKPTVSERQELDRPLGPRTIQIHGARYVRCSVEWLVRSFVRTFVRWFVRRQYALRDRGGGEGAGSRAGRFWRGSPWRGKHDKPLNPEQLRRLSCSPPAAKRTGFSRTVFLFVSSVPVNPVCWVGRSLPPSLRTSRRSVGGCACVRACVQKV